MTWARLSLFIDGEAGESISNVYLLRTTSIHWRLSGSGMRVSNAGSRISGRILAGLYIQRGSC